jgi:carboxypeptidase Q
MRGRSSTLGRVTAWVSVGIGLLPGLAACGGGAAPDRSSPDTGTLADIATRSVEISPMPFHADTLMEVIGARVSALPSGDSAEVFVARRLEAMGLEEVRLEPFDLLAWDRREASFEVVEPRGAVRGSLNILSLGHVGSFDVTAPLLDAGYGTAEEITELGDRVKGKVVMVDVGSPPGYGRGVHRTEKVTLATNAGAVGFLQVNNREGPLVPVGVATMGDYETGIPALAADYATGARLQEVLALAGGELRVRIRISNWMERSSARNVLADIPGETDEIVLVGAHLDSWDLAEGAVDNGSGTLATLDAAAALADHVRRTGERPLRTIRFAFWMGEELGLYGSRAHVEDRQEDGRLARYAAVLNMDVVGAPEGLGAMGRPEAEPLLRRVRDALAEAGFELDDEFPTGGSLYSDHQPFLMQGIPIVTIRSRQRPEAGGVSHTTADLRRVLDESGMARTAGVAAALLWAVANEPELGWARWPEDEIGPRLEALGLRDPLERAGEWRWP